MNKYEDEQRTRLKKYGLNGLTHTVKQNVNILTHTFGETEACNKLN